MPCFHPLTAYLSGSLTENGKRGITFNAKESFAGYTIKVPCGQCIGCRLERSRMWAVRCVHEASLYERNCFITLTFDDKHLPEGGSLVKHGKDFSDFMKRLRKRFGSGVRYFHCGEYGELLCRPHHHACLFNFDFPDKVFWSKRGGVNLYISKSLTDLWEFGFSSIGDVTFESAAYVARYVVKKITGKSADAYYKGLTPEYVTMSRRPGIASGWLDKFKSDVYPDDFIVIRDGVKCRAPRFYDIKYDLTNHVDLLKIKLNRLRKARLSPDNTRERLAVREEVKRLVLASNKRSFESGLTDFK